jgi:hypothetical protein
MGQHTDGKTPDHLLLFGHGVREVEDQSKFRQLRRLKCETWKHNPASRPTTIHPDSRDENQNQNNKTKRQKRISKPTVQRGRNHRAGDQRDSAGSHRDHLFAKKIGAVAIAFLRIEIAGTQNHCHTDGQKTHNREKHPLVHGQTVSHNFCTRVLKALPRSA